MKSMKKLLSIIFVLVMVLNLSSCKSSKNDDGVVRGQVHENDYIALVTDLSGINDVGDNALAWKGMQRARDELGFDIEYLESFSQDDYRKNIEYFTRCALDMLFCMNFEMASAVEEIAHLYPDECYAMINYTFDKVPQNVLCIEFEDQEGAFVEGYLAAYKTETNKVGVIGSVRSWIIGAYEYGFRAGVAAAAKELGKDITVDVEYVGSFYDEETAKEKANQMYQNGVDIIFSAFNGVGGKGVEDSAIENNKYFIGVEYSEDMAPKNLLSWTSRDIDKVVFNVAKEIKEVNAVKEITGQSRCLGMADDAVSIAEKTKTMVSEEIMNKLIEVENKIKNKEIDPPWDEDSFEKFMQEI